MGQGESKPQKPKIEEDTTLPWPNTYNILVCGPEGSGKSIIINQLFANPYEYKKKYINKDNTLSNEIVGQFSFFMFAFIYLFVTYLEIDPKALLPPGQGWIWDSLIPMFEKALGSGYYVGSNLAEDLSSHMRFNSTNWSPNARPEDHHWQLLKILWNLPEIQKSWLKRENLSQKILFDCNYFHYWMNFSNDFCQNNVQLETNLPLCYSFPDRRPNYYDQPRVFGLDELFIYIRALNYQQELIEIENKSNKKDQISSSQSSEPFPSASPSNIPPIPLGIINPNTDPETYRELYLQSEYYLRGYGPDLPPVIKELPGTTYSDPNSFFSHRINDDQILPTRVTLFPGKFYNNWDHKFDWQQHHIIYFVNLSHCSGLQLSSSLDYLDSWIQLMSPEYPQRKLLQIDQLSPKKIKKFGNPPKYIENFYKNGAKITFIFTHRDVLWEKIKSNLIDMTIEHQNSFIGDQYDVDYVEKWIIEQYFDAWEQSLTKGPRLYHRNNLSVQIPGGVATVTAPATAGNAPISTSTSQQQQTVQLSQLSSQLPQRPECIIVNGLDRFDVLEKVGPLFTDMMKNNQ